MCTAGIKWKMEALHFILQRALQPPRANFGIVRPLGHDGVLIIHI